MSIELLVKDIDGVEFYTDTKTGRSGISQSGLAILCGVDEKSVRNAVNSIRTSQPYKGLEHLVGKLSECRTETESGMWLCNDELCIAIIRYYDRKGRQPAQFTFDKFAAIGFNVWVQGITGWSKQPGEQAILDRLDAIAQKLEEIKNPTPEETPWTPPPLYPNMTREEWDSLNLCEKLYYSESYRDREARRMRELRELRN